MPNWSEISDEIAREQQSAAESPLDVVRRRYLAQLTAKTGRNAIAYYSGWLTLGVNAPGLQIDDDDKSGLMTAVHRLDRSKGLDLILHTPGGDIAATESIVFYLRQMFGADVRAIIPQIAMSAGTMIACSAKSIVLGKQSSLGPIDPQFGGGISAPAVLHEFDRAIKEIETNPHSLPLWQTIIGKYHPTFLDSCHRAIDWSKRIVADWLRTGMFEGEPDAEAKAQKIVDALSNHDEHKTHARHIHYDQCEALGMKIERLEDDGVLQDLVLSVHHCYLHTCSQSQVIKIIENQDGVTRVKSVGSA